MMLYEKITDALTDAVRSGELIPGAQLPAIAALRSEYNVSHITALRVYKELVLAGIAEKHGRGYRVRLPEQPDNGELAALRQRVIGIFFRPWRSYCEDNYANEINLALEQSVIAAQYDYLRTFAIRNFLNKGEGVSDGAAIIAANMSSIGKRSAGILIDERITDEALKLFMEEMSMPAVLVNRESELAVSSVAGDNAGALIELLRNAAHLKYGRILFCDEGPTHYWNDAARKTVFRNLVETRRDLMLDFFRIGSISGNSGEYLQGIKELLEVKSAPRTLFFCNHDRVARVLCEGIMSLGLTPGRDCGVCGFYNCNMTFGNGRRLSSIRFDTNAIGQKSVELLLNRIKFSWNFLPERIRIPGEFIFGDSM